MNEKNEKTEDEILYEEAIAQFKRLLLLSLSAFSIVILFHFGGSGVVAVFAILITGAITKHIFAYIGILLFFITSLLAIYIANKILNNFFLPQGHKFIDVGTERALKGYKND